MGLFTRIQLRTVGFSEAFGAAVTCVPAQLFAQTTPPTQRGTPRQWPASAQAPLAPGTAPPAQGPRQSPFPASPAPASTPPAVLWMPPTGHAFAVAAPRRNRSEEH